MKIWNMIIPLQFYSKEEGKDQDSIQSLYGRVTKTQVLKKTLHTREPRGQPFPNM